MITDFHAKYFAYELMKRCASDSMEKLAPVLADAQVDLNPHQVEAALFAFRSPFSKGAILAEEVGLGKTIEAGLLLSQNWAEGKRRLLVIVPASLCDGGGLLDEAHCRRLLDLPGVVTTECFVPAAVVTALLEEQGHRQQELLHSITSRNGTWFDLEMDKLDRWAEDRLESLKARIDELTGAFKAAKRAARLAPSLPEKLLRQREARVLETQRDDAWREYDHASREIEEGKEGLLDEVARRLDQHTETRLIFTVRWHLA